MTEKAHDKQNEKRLELVKTVEASDVTRNDTMRVKSLMQFLQHGADRHATALGVGYDFCKNKNITWVGRSYRIRIEQMPKRLEQVRLQTWPSEANKLTATREFLMVNEKGELLLKASSAWILIDIDKRKILPLKDHLPDYDIDSTRALETNFAKIEDLGNIAQSSEQTVRFDDIDINQHINNAVYVLWAAEEIEQSHNDIKQIDIDFKKEGVLGDKITIDTTINGHEVKHSIFKEENDEKTELARIKMTYENHAELRIK